MRLSYQKITFLIAVGLFFVLQIIQLCFKPFPEPGLRGLQVEPPWPVLNFQSWATGEFQGGYEKWLGYNFGFRGYWIRTYNQVAYSLFKEASQGADDKIIVGKKEQLYERAYIDEYFNFTPPAEISDLAAKAQRIKRLQDLLQQRGIASIVLITPSKASIYPEYIPDAFKNIAVTQNRNYPNFVNLLKQYDVQYVDGHEIIAEQKRKSEYPLFCRGGTHWNYLGVYYTTREMILKLQEQVNQSMTNLECTRVDIDDNPTGSDKDLAYLLNLWRTPDRYPTPHPVVTAAPGLLKPNILFVGGSFAGLIVQTLAQNAVCSNIDYYFYYNKRLVCQDGKELKEAGLIDKLDWERDIFSRDMIVLEVNEQNIPNMGSGFIEDALSKLEPSEVRFVLKNEHYVTEVPVNGKKGYLLKKGAPASGCLYLATDYLTLEPGAEYEIAYTTKGYKTLKLDICGDGFTQTVNDSVQNEEKRYYHQFKCVNKGNFVLRFYIDEEPGFTDRDALIYDIQLNRITKH